MPRITTPGKRTNVLAWQGPPGVGKSMLARALSARLGWPLLDTDDIKDRLDDQTEQAGALGYGILQRASLGALEGRGSPHPRVSS